MIKWGSGWGIFSYSNVCLVLFQCSKALLTRSCQNVVGSAVEGWNVGKLQRHVPEEAMGQRQLGGHPLHWRVDQHLLEQLNAILVQCPDMLSQVAGVPFGKRSLMRNKIRNWKQ